MIAGLVAAAVGLATLIAPGSGRGATEPAAAVVPTPSDPAATPSAATPSAAGTPAPHRSSSATPSARTSAAPEKIVVSARGPGTYRAASLSLPAPKGRGRVVTFDVRVERGLALDPKAVAREIHTTLADPRSWPGEDHVRFQLVSNPAKARLHAYVVTPGTTDRLCYPWLTRGAVSCQTGNRVVLNAKRWVFGAEAYGRNVRGYRQYLVNHEFGHSLGYDHVGCPAKGRPAPVMMQQTKGLKGCRPNPWPTVAR